MKLYIRILESFSTLIFGFIIYISISDYYKVANNMYTPESTYNSARTIFIISLVSSTFIYLTVLFILEFLSATLKNFKVNQEILETLKDIKNN